MRLAHVGLSVISIPHSREKEDSYPAAVMENYAALQLVVELSVLLLYKHKRVLDND